MFRHLHKRVISLELLPFQKLSFRPVRFARSVSKLTVTRSVIVSGTDNDTPAPREAQCCQEQQLLLTARASAADFMERREYVKRMPHHPSPLLSIQIRSPISYQKRLYAKNKGGSKGKHDKKHDKQNKPKVELVGDELSEVIDVEQMKHKLQSSLDHMSLEFSEQLSLRTSVGILDNLHVKTSDGTFPLIQLAQVVQKTPQLFIVDLTGLPQYMAAVKDAIQNSGMNLNPQQDGTSIYVPIPPVTREYRENLAKNAKMLCDKTKVKLRNIHNHYMKDLNTAKKNKDTSKELIKNLEDHVHYLMKQFSDKADDMMHQKQQELLKSK